MRTILLSAISLTGLCVGMAFHFPVAAEEGDAPAVVASADPRDNLAPGLYTPGTASWNMELVTNHPSPPGFFDPGDIWAAPAPRPEGEPAPETPARRSPIAFANTDLAFSGNRIVMGNFHGFNVFETNENHDLRLILSVVCPGGQGDVSIHGNLVFHSVEQNRARLDCGAGGVEGESSAERFRGVRIFDISDVNNPRQVAAVQTCRGSHTNTIIPHATDPNIIYIYNSGISGVRLDTELTGCFNATPEENPDTALYSIDIIKVELDAPEKAAIVNRPRVFADPETGAVNGLWAGGTLEEGAQRTSATTACHDMTAYPEYNLVAGACSGNGILLDITDRENPVRIDDIADRNMAFWHSATFTNDASKILFSDEWGGGVNARCRVDDPKNWGANIVTDRTQEGMKAQGYFKIPTVQTEQENCVSHNGSLIPVPGRDIMVQGWYSGGVSVFDFTNSQQPVEIAYFDRGPVSAEELHLAGHWAAYWHNGMVYAPEIARGLDIFDLQPSDYLSANELEAAKLIRFEEANTQVQVKFEWPAHPAVAGAYLDQLKRSGAVEAGNRLGVQLEKEIDRWKNGKARPSRLRRLVPALENAAAATFGRDAARFAALADVFNRAE